MIIDCCYYAMLVVECRWQCKLRGFLAERKGEREDMQDAHTILDDFTPQFCDPLPNDM